MLRRARLEVQAEATARSIGEFPAGLPMLLGDHADVAAYHKRPQAS
jgi:hypothetical protein